MKLGILAMGAAVLGAGIVAGWALLPREAARSAPATAALRSASASSATVGPSTAAGASAASASTPPASTGTGAAGGVDAEGPRFDVARVGARGMLVAAGRAAPLAEVVLFDGGQEIGRARADARGEWVILPSQALAAGARELSLHARRPGESVVPGREVVLVVVPDAMAPAGPRLAAATDTTPGTSPGTSRGEPGRTAAATPLAVLLPAPGASPSAEAPRLLQVPIVLAPAEGTAGRGQRLGLDIVDYEEGGEIRFAGSAPPGARVRLYVGRDHAGDAQANAAGRWQLTPAGQPPVGQHTLRVDQLAAGGGVAARIEVPFRRESLAGEPPEGAEQLVVQPGHSLWRIARRVYGRGTRYTVIYDANREQIRDPQRIYPGQVFALPGGAAALPGSSAPAASSLSR